jgi:quinol monooxygenase YgiN
LEDYIRKVIGHVQSEPGVLIYEVARDQQDRLKFLVFERYAGRAAFKAHIETKAFLDMWESGVLDGALEPSFFVPIESTSN